MTTTTKLYRQQACALAMLTVVVLVTGCASNSTSEDSTADAAVVLAETESLTRTETPTTRAPEIKAPKSTAPPTTTTPPTTAPTTTRPPTTTTQASPTLSTPFGYKRVLTDSGNVSIAIPEGWSIAPIPASLPANTTFFAISDTHSATLNIAEKPDQFTADELYAEVERVVSGGVHELSRININGIDAVAAAMFPSEAAQGADAIFLALPIEGGTAWLVMAGPTAPGQAGIIFNSIGPAR